MGSGWVKFAILGSTYARALQNRAVRTHGAENVNPATFASTGAQPQARFDTDLSSYARQRGALAPTAQSRAMSSLAHDLPWQGAEHQAPASAHDDANKMLEARGLSHNAPTGQLTSHQRIEQTFGKPTDASGGTDVGRARLNPRRQGPHPLQHLDEWQQQNPDKPRNWIPPAQSTTYQAPQRTQTHAQTQVGSMGGWQPQATARPTAAARPTGAPSTTQLLQSMRAERVPTMTRPGGTSTAVLTRPPVPNMATQVLKAGAAQFKIANPASLMMGIGLPLAVGGSMLLNKPGIKADLADRLHGEGDIHQKDVAQAIPEEVMGTASRASQALAERGIDPKAMRFAVDAPSGAGKTVLSKALAQQMGLQHHGLDWRPNMRMHQLMGGGDIEKMPYTPHAGEILEHQQLLRSYDPEMFDVALHIHKDPNTIKQQVLKRGRGARTADLLDYDKSIDVGRKAFETLGGDAIDLGGGVMMKVRPQEGWGNQLDQQLATQGIDPSGLTRHQKLLSLHSGKREAHGSGWTPYVKNPFSSRETSALGSTGLLGASIAGMLGKQGGALDIVHDLSPLARRMLGGAAIGGVGGAAFDSEHRGRGALLGAAGGAGLGAGYNALRPINPAAMPGEYEALFRPRIRGFDTDYESLFSRGREPKFQPPQKYPHTPISNYPDYQGPTHDRVKRPIQLHAVPDIGQNAAHLTMRSPVSADTMQQLADAADAAYDTSNMTFGHTGDALPSQRVRLEYGGSLKHDPQESASINEMRRQLRKRRG